MKSKFKSAILLFSGVAMLATPAMAVVTANGDLLIGFYKVNTAIVEGFEVVTGVTPNTYIFNLGAASIYRENTLNNVSVTTVNPALASNNIGTDLVNAFGAGWANATAATPTSSGSAVYWSIFGGANANTPGGGLNGDVAKTPYISKPVSIYNPAGIATTTAPTGASGGVDANGRSNITTQITSINQGSNGTGTNVGNAAGAKIAASGNLGTSVDSFFPPTTSTQLTLGTELRGLFGSGTVSGSTSLEGALDVYRYISSGSGTDFTAGRSAGNAALGVGQYIGTFTIDGLGNLAVGQISAVPEPSGALALGLIGTIAGLGYRSRRSNKLA